MKRIMFFIFLMTQLGLYGEPGDKAVCDLPAEKLVVVKGVLDLSYQGLTSLKGLDNFDLGSVRKLDLSHNNLADLEDVFSGLKKIRSLDLTHNEGIKELPESFFEIIGNLIKLRFSINPKENISLTFLIGLLIRRLPEEVDGDCSICSKEFDDKNHVFRSDCNHHFHKSCTYRFLKSAKKPAASIECPVCGEDMIRKTLEKFRETYVVDPYESIAS